MTPAFASFVPLSSVSSAHLTPHAVSDAYAHPHKCSHVHGEPPGAEVHFAVKRTAGSDGIVKSTSFQAFPAASFRPQAAVAFNPSFVDRSLPMAVLLQRRQKRREAFLEDLEDEEEFAGGDDGSSIDNSGHGRGGHKCPTCSDREYVDCSYCETEDGMVWDYAPFTPVSRFQAWG